MAFSATNTVITVIYSVNSVVLRQCCAGDPKLRVGRKNMFCNQKLFPLFQKIC